jgi:hypothetical protein
MKRLSALIFLLLALPATAYAGGWATAGLSSTPEGTKPGGVWKVDITVMQHGRTPLEGVQPAIVVSHNGSDQRFDAVPTDEPGVYRAEVGFPAAGTYEYTVDDGFGNAFPHEFPPVNIAGESVAAAGGTPWWPFALLGAALLAAGVALLVRRGRGAAPQPA